MALTGAGVLSTLLGAVVDGGVGQPFSLGLLVALALVTLTLPPSRAWPYILFALSLYLGLAVLGPPANGWYVAFHVVAVLVLTWVCGGQGRALARQRRRLLRLSRL